MGPGDLSLRSGPGPLASLGMGGYGRSPAERGRQATSAEIPGLDGFRAAYPKSHTLGRGDEALQHPLSMPRRSCCHRLARPDTFICCGPTTGLWFCRCLASTSMGGTAFVQPRSLAPRSSFLQCFGSRLRDRNSEVLHAGTLSQQGCFHLKQACKGEKNVLG